MSQQEKPQVSWKAIEANAPVFSSEGEAVGKVKSVVGDPDADSNETALLGELGFDSLLMVAIEAEDGAWGLVEVYGEKGRRFDEGQVALARELAREVSELLRKLERPA